MNLGEFSLYPKHLTVLVLISRSRARLLCGVHECPLRCHRIADHSRIMCTIVIERTCERQHKLKVKCGKKDERCRECLREDQEQERRLKRDLGLEEKRLARQAAYRQELEQIEDEIDYQRRQIQYMREEEDQKKEMAQKRKDAKDMLATAARMRKAKTNDDMQARGQAEPELKTRRGGSDTLGPAERDWQWLKENLGAESQTLDDLIGMVGLDVVKQEFLSVKTKVDTMLRQNASLASERFNCVMLGNPGTGTFRVRRMALLICRQAKQLLRVSTRSFCARSASSPATVLKRLQVQPLHTGAYLSARSKSTSC